MLLAHALGCDRTALFRRSEEAVSDEEAARFERLLSRRAAREPVQQIVGCTEFWSLRIRCDSRALIPRPETEILVEAALGLLKGAPSPFIADIGTGTGCIAIALATELPGGAHLRLGPLARRARAGRAEPGGARSGAQGAAPRGRPGGAFSGAGTRRRGSTRRCAIRRTSRSRRCDSPARGAGP